MATIDRYLVKGLLGRGGMGKVYKVQVPVIGRILALKILSPAGPLEAVLGMEELERRFVAEAVTMARLHHPHVASVIGFGRHGGRPYYLQDFYDNHLGLVMGEGRPEEPSRILPLPRAARYVGQLLEGLARLHHAGIVHRDIKPANLLLTPEDDLRIGDFGLSKIRGERFPTPPSLRVGTPWYAPPEQERDPEAATPAADLYAAGVVLFRLLTGRLPDAPDDSPLRLNPDLDPPWEAFFRRALHPDPQARFPHAADMRQAVDNLVAAWRLRLADACRLWSPAPESAGEEPPPAPRRTPLKTGHRGNRARLGLDALWRPRVWSSSRLRREGEHLVVDDGTRLIWQYAGSPYPLEWREAWDYVAGLNRRGFAGRTDWRLPTVAELTTLLRPPPSGADHCLPPVFPPGPRSLWSSDRRAYTSAWYVSLDLGYVAWHDLDCRRHVKAAAGGRPAP
jgi:serine/threonine-protein kinase